MIAFVTGDAMQDFFDDHFSKITQDNFSDLTEGNVKENNVPKVPSLNT
jgi:hypothetical protein